MVMMMIMMMMTMGDGGVYFDEMYRPRADCKMVERNNKKIKNSLDDIEVIRK